MGLMLAAKPVQGDLVAKVRERIAAGAAVREIAVEDAPFWFVAELGDDAARVQNVFRSEHALVAVLEGGRTVVRRARI